MYVAMVMQIYDKCDSPVWVIAFLECIIMFEAL